MGTLYHNIRRVSNILFLRLFDTLSVKTVQFVSD